MPKIPILNDQSVIVADTLTREGSTLIILKAADATPVFISQQRGDLDGNLDSGLNPQGGIPITSADPPLILTAVRAQLWARAAIKTSLYVEVLELSLSVYQNQKVQTPRVQPRYVRPVGVVPTYDENYVQGRPR